MIYTTPLWGVRGAYDKDEICCYGHDLFGVFRPC